MDLTKLVGLDFETYASVPLPEVGLARYVNDPYFWPTLASFAHASGPVNTIEFPALSTRAVREQLDGKVVCAHNAGFERAVLKTMGIDIPVIDSAVVAAVAGADRHLAGAAQQLLNSRKLDDDRSLLRLFAMPQAVQVDPSFDSGLVAAHPDKWAMFKDYCERDAVLSRDLVLDWAGQVSLFEKEMRYAQITLDMNEAGWPVDITAVEEMRKRYLENLDRLKADFALAVDKDLNLFSHAQVKKWCADRGVRSNSFDKQHVEALIQRLLKQAARTHLTDEQQQVMDLLITKQALGGSSLKKLETILATAYEGRVYDQYVHAGAPQSLRTSGRSVQMQNLPKLGSSPRFMNDLYSSGARWTNDDLSENMRQVFTASDPQGFLVVADFASIESRALGYLAGEAWKVNAYAAGEDVYKAQAMKIYRLGDVNDVTKEQRTTGKVGELSCGYGAGPVAVKDFAAKMHVELSESEAAKLVRDWRDANPNTVAFWQELGDALYQVVEGVQQRSVHAAHGITIAFWRDTTPQSLFDQMPGAQTVEMALWSKGQLVMSRVFHGCYLRGRNVGYHKPSSLKGGRPWKTKYVDPKTKRPRFYELYGGKLAGILTQSLCREIFFESLEEISKALKGVPNATLVGQFHDEVVVDWVPGDVTLIRVHNLLKHAMSRSATHPALPMGVEVKFDYRYTKQDPAPGGQTPGAGPITPTGKVGPMYSPTVVGVDPGLVHTGIVMLDFNVDERHLTVDHRVVDGLDAAAARAEVENMTQDHPYATLDIFIEQYRPRSGFGVDEKMVQANSDFRHGLSGQLLRNTGVKKVVSRELMELLSVWMFATGTHHQDLRSAARIALLGMMLNPALNKVLYTFATDNLEGRNWDVRVF